MSHECDTRAFSDKITHAGGARFILEFNTWVLRLPALLLSSCALSPYAIAAYDKRAVVLLDDLPYIHTAELFKRAFLLSLLLKAFNYHGLPRLRLGSSYNQPGPQQLTSSHCTFVLYCVLL